MSAFPELSRTVSLLQGSPVRIYDARLRLAGLGAMSALAGVGGFFLPPYGGLPVLVAGWLLLRMGRSLNVLNTANDAGIKALNDGRYEEATSSFRALLASGVSRSYGSVVLHNLSVVALRQGSFEDCLALCRAGLACLSKKDSFDEPARQELLNVETLALLGLGRFDEAEQALNDREINAVGAVRAQVLRQRTLLACRRGQYEAALALLDKHREFFERLSAGSDVALLEALEAFALDRLGGAFRGASPERRPTLVHGVEIIEQIDRMLPGASAFLKPR